MNYFDAHTHTNFAAYDSDRDEVFARAKDAGVGMNVVGTQIDTSRVAVECAEKYGQYASVGLHPVHTARSFHDAQELGNEGEEFTSRGEVFDSAAYESLAASVRVVAIGECGLDYYRNDARTKKVQEDAFVQQIELANKLGKPLMLHVRASEGTMDAYDDALEIIRSHAKVAGDVHFFAGNLDVAKRFLSLGFTLSFTGVITFARSYDEVVRETPLDMLLSETDAPYVSPTPHRGRRNEPGYVIEVVRAIARIKAMNEEDVARQLMTNVRRVFGVPLA